LIVWSDCFSHGELQLGIDSVELIQGVLNVRLLGVPDDQYVIYVPMIIYYLMFLQNIGDFCIFQKLNAHFGYGW
jgi:uncharacterized membrane protein